MLETIDLGQSIEKAEYKSLMDDLKLKLGELQRNARTGMVPVMIVFEGWDAAGKGTMINRLILALDPRGFNVYPINKPNDEERHRPFLWRFWTRTPDKGRIAIFDRSWYGRVLVERVDTLIDKEEWTRAYDEINQFERQLADDGTLIVKFFLHISKKEQSRRFDKLRSASATAWKVTREDLRHHRQYKKYLKATEEMLEKTSTSWAPWTVIPSHDRRFAAARVFSTIIEALEERLEQPVVSKAPQKKHHPLKASESLLDKVDTSAALKRRDYDRELEKYQQKINELEYCMFLKRIPVIIVYEGWDAAGKGGNIRRFVQGLDPRGYEVVPIAAPNDVEKQHHYLWRFWSKMPKAGHITIFDRSWYGRVLVERVEGFCRPDEWKRAYREINEMEEQWMNFGASIFKFWLHIDSQEQLRRFKDRQKTSYKQWKITDEDWRNREKWDLYKEAVDEMLFRTSTSFAPWTIVEANCKLYARVKTLKTVVDALSERA
jgi:polyphosphate:AMP phosphotransferase